LKSQRNPSLAVPAGRAILAGLLLSAAPAAAALTVDVTNAGPSVVGEAHAFTAVVTGGSGAIKYEWQFGETADVETGSAEMSHTFTDPGLVSIQVFATDATGDSASAFFRHLVHYPLTPKSRRRRRRSSTTPVGTASSR
jgi:hypothetical protein